MNNVRPIYETAGNKAAERFVIGDVCRKFGCTPLKLPDLSPVDYILAKGDHKTFVTVEGNVNFSAYLYQQMAIAEVKCRSNASDAYPTYMLSYEKFQKAVLLSQTTRWPFLLIVCFADCIKFWKYHPDHLLHYAVGGRDDRDDLQDVELVVHIPMEQFTVIEEGGNYEAAFLPAETWMGHAF